MSSAAADNYLRSFKRNASAWGLSGILVRLSEAELPLAFFFSGSQVNLGQPGLRIPAEHTSQQGELWRKEQVPLPVLQAW
jgi:hypothetical protein